MTDIGESVREIEVVPQTEPVPLREADPEPAETPVVEEPVLVP